MSHFNFFINIINESKICCSEKILDFLDVLYLYLREIRGKSEGNTRKTKSPSVLG